MNIKTFVQRHPLATYFGASFIISWGSGLVVLVPKLVRGEAIPATDALLLFPVLVVGVGLTGIILTGIMEGRSGVRNLLARIGRWRVGVRWYAAAFLIPPGLIMLVLLSLSTLVSPDFAPNFFPLGTLFGLFPGFFEEIGWTGFAFPRMQSQYGALPASILLGCFGGCGICPWLITWVLPPLTAHIGCPFFSPSSRSWRPCAS
jgi:membrane protease YdiL (CAAX protease family)